MEFPVVWGGCARCHGGVGVGGYLVWAKDGRTGWFACPRHLNAVRAMAGAGCTVEAL